MQNDVIIATQWSLQRIDHKAIDQMAEIIARVREQHGRVFVIGNGGGSSHASHFVCDLRKLCGVEAYCPSDNMAELTARMNDDSWASTYMYWLEVSRLSDQDALVVISVGGGSDFPPVSQNIVYAVDMASGICPILAIVGRDGGYAGKRAAAKVVIPCNEPGLVTPVVESVQAVVLHALAVHPLLQKTKTKWEGIEK